MVFNSLVFLVFLPVVVVTYWSVGQRRRSLVLLAASYAFYAAWDVRFLGLIVASTAVDYCTAIKIDRSGDRRYVWVSVSFNLGVLGIFKYLGFFVSSAVEALNKVGFEISGPALHIALPVGISFYTFQSLAYTIDVSRGHLSAIRDPFLFAAFVAFFPQLVAGPIERASYLLPQLSAPNPLSLERMERAVRLFMRGLVLKVVIADTMAPIVNDAFASPSSAGVLGVGFASLAFAVQIYGDFAGYTSMALGVALLFGVELSRNFTQPYLSKSLTEFWRRWHITLSAWLRDYLYIPLGGNRRGPTRKSLNIAVVMALGGLWHGAAWTYVIWGMWHALWLALERRRPAPIATVVPGIRDVPGIVYTFTVITIGWVLFRAESLQTMTTLAAQIRSGSLGPMPRLSPLVLVAMATTLVLWMDISARYREASPKVVTAQDHPVKLGALLASSIALLLIFGATIDQPFIYFQF